MSTEPSDGVAQAAGPAAVRPARSLDAARGARRLVGLLGVTALAMAAAETALPALLGKAVDGVASAHVRLGGSGAALAVAVVVVTDIADDVVTGATTARCAAWLRHGLLRKVLALGPHGGSGQRR